MNEQQVKDAGPALLAALIKIIYAMSELPAGVPAPEYNAVTENLWDTGRDAIRQALGLTQ